MSNKAFFLRFGIFSLFTALLILFQPHIQVLARHTTLSWMTWGIFSFLILNLYVLGTWALSSSDKHAFDRITMFFHFFKIAAALIYFFYYHKNFAGEGRWHALSFVALYVLYTTFEVDMLTRMVRR